MSKDKNLALVNALRVAIKEKEHIKVLEILEKLIDSYKVGDDEFKQEVKKAFAENGNGKTLLHIAAEDTIHDIPERILENAKPKSKHYKLIKFLLEVEKKPNCQDAKKNTPIYYLLRDSYNNFKTIKLFLKENTLNKEEVFCALRLILLNNSGVAETLTELLLKNFPNDRSYIINGEDANHETVLFTAVRVLLEKATKEELEEKKDFRLIKVLLKHGANADMANEDKKTIIDVILDEIDKVKEYIQDEKEKNKRIQHFHELQEKLRELIAKYSKAPSVPQVLMEEPVPKPREAVEITQGKESSFAAPAALLSSPVEATQENQEKSSPAALTQLTDVFTVVSDNKENLVKDRASLAKARGDFFKPSTSAAAPKGFALDGKKIKRTNGKTVRFSVNPGQSSKETSELTLHQQARSNTPHFVKWEHALLREGFEAMENYFLVEDDSGNTPLHIAVLHSSKSFIVELYEFITTKGFDTIQQHKILSVKNKNGQIPYDMLQFNDKDSEKLLADWGSLLRESNNNVNTDGPSYLRLANSNTAANICSPTTPLGQPNFPSAAFEAGKEQAIRGSDTDISWLRRLFNWIIRVFKKPTSTPVIVVTPSKPEVSTLVEQGSNSGNTPQNDARNPIIDSEFTRSTASSNSPIGIGCCVFKQESTEKKEALKMQQAVLVTSCIMRH